ncbi:TetR/AcrR family transcriptional regulator [Yinghuangia soli]|uniref:TetR/AcrR family transcriptional regulator n=1 Tax=Yinghuangia soli TaxID=2908204 RepID=A0AA41Q8L3_9ACTN|nr:TetR/AcrR family transcriptional regulator [Yinghuangia soli]MCF2533605.1 TetR/AcrR family transcriptional regulator [Yinghuangia soli]
MSEAGQPRLRRQPQQARSRARVEAVLAAADRILAQEGYEALTMRRVADEAGVPVGSIYQFYPDKGAVVDALGQQYLGNFKVAIDGLVERALAGELPDFVDTVVDEYADLFRRQAGGVALWSGRHVSTELARADEASNALVAEGLRRIMEYLLGRPADARIERAARMVVWVADSVLSQVFRPGAQAGPETLDELKAMLRVYWDDLRGGATAGG